MATSLEEIFAEMIERRPLLTPMSSLKPPRQSSRSSKRRVRFAADCLAPRRKIRRLKRSDAPERREVWTWRLWRMKPGLYELVAFESETAEAILRKVGTSDLMKICLPPTMDRPGSSTHLEMKKAGEDPQYPRGKAEWLTH